MRPSAAPICRVVRGPLVAIPLTLGTLAPGLAAEPPPHYGPLLSAPPKLNAGPPEAADAKAADYDRCMAQTREDPAAARKFALSWETRGGGHPARHCLAVALIGLKQYKEAAGRLETLGQEMIHGPAALRAGVFGQAGQAWLLAGDPGRAYAADTAALKLLPDDPDLLVDRAQAAGLAGWYDKAVADLDRVLKTDPARVDALIFRASAYRKQERLDAALADIEAALRQASGSAPALLERGNIRSLRGDLEGARADWRRVSDLAPGSAAAAAAKQNLDRVDAAGTTPPAPKAAKAR
jgi:tetratricopeptide (TPR) repeat protein